jgi:hypothetical protein
MMRSARAYHGADHLTALAGHMGGFTGLADRLRDLDRTALDAP